MSENRRECMFVEFDIYGNSRYCDWDKAVDISKPEEREFCKVCLEGMKVEAMSFLCEIQLKRARKDGLDGFV